MYYDDKARQFNFVSGLLFGAVLGAGVALLWEPQDQVRSLLRRRPARARWRKRVAGVSDSLAEVASTGRKYLKR